MSKAFFVNQRTGKKYEIVSFDQEAGTVTLKGEMAVFTEDFDKAKFKAMGYTLERIKSEEPEDAEQS